MLDIRWYGRGGQGAFTAARLLGRAASVYEGKYALAYPSFGPERRGAPVWSFTRIDEKKVIDRAQPAKCDCLIVLDETLVTPAINDVLKEDSIVIMNTLKPEEYSYIHQKMVTLDATGMALKLLGRPITNVAMLGALVGVTGTVTLENADRVVKDNFNAKLYEKNSALLKAAYETVKGGEK